LKVSARKLLAAITLLAAILSATGAPDDVGREYTDGALTRALTSFAIARGLNGVISAVQGTEVSLQPGGVGVTFTPGEILDPLNDMVERFSWVMLASSVSLGVQELLLVLSSWSGFVWLSAVLGLFAAVLLLRIQPTTAWAPWVIKAVWVLMFLRFAVPVFALVNEVLYVGFLAPRYEEASAKLENVAEQLKEMKREDLPSGDSGSGGGLLDRAQRFLVAATATLDMNARMQRYQQLADEASRDAVNLIVVFVFYTFLSPLAFLFVLMRFIKAVWRVRVERLWTQDG
jgi:hypothetical protein